MRCTMLKKFTRTAKRVAALCFLLPAIIRVSMRPAYRSLFAIIYV